VDLWSANKFWMRNLDRRWTGDLPHDAVATALCLFSGRLDDVTSEAELLDAWRAGAALWEAGLIPRDLLREAVFDVMANAYGPSCAERN
jgi:hypothetical protein